ncbi:hypothetical protein ACFX1X_000150 [Malus domestica]
MLWMLFIYAMDSTIPITLKFIWFAQIAFVEPEVLNDESLSLKNSESIILNMQLPDKLHWYVKNGDTIMGLNPPLEVKTGLTNKFIDKV